MIICTHFAFSLHSQEYAKKKTPLHQFRYIHELYIKFPPNTIGLSTRLWGISPTNSGCHPEPRTEVYYFRLNTTSLTDVVAILLLTAKKASVIDSGSRVTEELVLLFTDVLL